MRVGRTVYTSDQLINSCVATSAVLRRLLMSVRKKKAFRRWQRVTVGSQLKSLFFMTVRYLNISECGDVNKRTRQVYDDTVYFDFDSIQTSNVHM